MDQTDIDQQLAIDRLERNEAFLVAIAILSGIGSIAELLQCVVFLWRGQ